MFTSACNIWPHKLHSITFVCRQVVSCLDFLLIRVAMAPRRVLIKPPLPKQDTADTAHRILDALLLWSTSNRQTRFPHCQSDTALPSGCRFTAHSLCRPWRTRQYCNIVFVRRTCSAWYFSGCVAGHHQEDPNRWGRKRRQGQERLWSGQGLWSRQRLWQGAEQGLW